MRKVYDVFSSSTAYLRQQHPFTALVQVSATCSIQRTPDLQIQAQVQLLVLHRLSVVSLRCPLDLLPEQNLHPPLIFPYQKREVQTNLPPHRPFLLPPTNVLGYIVHSPTTRISSLNQLPLHRPHFQQGDRSSFSI
jgi:hypothetical protein